MKSHASNANMSQREQNMIAVLHPVLRRMIGRNRESAENMGIERK
jgi:hypothetical protein